MSSDAADASLTSSAQRSAFVPAALITCSSAALDLEVEAFSAVSLSSVLHFIPYRYGLKDFSLGQNICEFLTSKNNKEQKKLLPPPKRKSITGALVELGH